MLKKIIIILTSLFIPPAVWAVLPYYTGARAEGMGGAYTSLSNDSSALFYNPAGLTDMEKNELSAMFWQDYFGTSYSNFSCALPRETWGGLAAGWSRTANSFEKTDVWGNVAGQGEVSNDVFMVGAGYCKDSPVSIGVTAKFINEKIDTYSVSGWALDAGTFVEVKPLRIGLVLQNAVSNGLTGTSLAGGTVNEKIPSTLRLGLSFSNYVNYKIRPLAEKQASDNADKLNLQYTIAADLAVPMDAPDTYTISPGAELWLNNTIAARLGYKEMRDFTAGLSLKFSSLRLDYAFIMSKELENSNLFSVSLFF